MTCTLSSPAQVPWCYTLRKTIGNRLFILKSRFKKIFGFRISRKRKKGTHFFRKRERVPSGFWKTWQDTLSLSKREPALFEKNEIYCSAFLVFFKKGLLNGPVVCASKKLEAAACASEKVEEVRICGNRNRQYNRQCNSLSILKSRFKKIFGFRISRKHKKGTRFFRKRERVLPGFGKT